MSDVNKKAIELLALGIDLLEGKVGDKGDTGPQGEKGEQGVPGRDGKDGAAGKDGVNGKDGKPGTKGPKGDKGETGPQGPAGRDGIDGKDAEAISPDQVIDITTPIIVQNVQKAVSSKTVTANDVQGLEDFVTSIVGEGVGGEGVSDHGALTGLVDDDHTQYHTDARGDIRYYTKSQIDTSLSGKANALGTDDNYVTDAEKTKLANLSGINTGDQDLSGLAATVHTHTVSQITDFPSLATVATSGDYNDLINKPTGGAGDVVGPASATDEAIPRFDTTTGKLLQGSTVSITDNGSIVIPENSSPTAASAGNMKFFSRQIANRLMPAFIGPSGLDSTLQPLLARNKIGYWNPPGNATTVPGVFGFTAPTVTGFTAAARNIATTNYFTRLRRLGYNSAATVGAVGQWRVAVYQYTVGSSTTNLGGFTYIIRFGISDAAAVAGARMFMGMRSSSTPANAEPSTLTNCIGIGHGASDTNFKIFYGGSSAQTPIDLGANFPSDTRSTDAYELALFSAPNSGDVHYEVTRLNTGNVATGTITNSGATVLPTNTTLIAPWGYRTNNATALAVSLDVMSAYIETDA